jgi:hypothetical protein
MGVPKTVAGETVEFVGARPEAVLLQAVKQAATEVEKPSGLIV